MSILFVRKDGDGKGLRKCILCGEETEGSVGKAGIHWKFLCQPCKDKEDNALEQMVSCQAKVLDDIECAIEDCISTKLKARDEEEHDYLYEKIQNLDLGQYIYNALYKGE